MLCDFGIPILQVQTANFLWSALAIVVSISGVIVSIMAVKLAKNKMEQENKEKMATKAYVLDKISKVDADVSNFRKEIEDHKHNNEREHDNIRKEVSQKLDLIIKLIEKNDKKSA